MPFNGWLVDLLVGILFGSIILGGLGESILITARVSGSTMVAAILIACGSILGVGFMRVVRARGESDRIRRGGAHRR